MKKLFKDEKKTQIEKTESSIISYRSFLKFFETKKEITSDDLIVGAHIAYGWMPRMLNIYTDKPEDDLTKGVKILNKVKKGNIDNDELKWVIHLINNSLVGTSKLLHFINPKKFSIWDSKVYSYFYQEEPYPYRVNNIKKYEKFMKSIEEIKKDRRFPAFHKSVNSKIGYDVSDIRAIEIIMYLTIKNNKKNVKSSPFI